jgi:hypothetical protein
VNRGGLVGLPTSSRSSRLQGTRQNILTPRLYQLSTLQLNPKATISDLLLIVAFLIILGYVGGAVQQACLRTREISQDVLLAADATVPWSCERECAGVYSCLQEHLLNRSLQDQAVLRRLCDERLSLHPFLRRTGQAGHAGPCTVIRF